MLQPAVGQGTAAGSFDSRPAQDFEARFLEPPGFVWGEFATTDGASLRWGHLGAAQPRAYCVLVGGFTEFVEKYFETIRDLTTRGISVWSLDWRGQGGSQRPEILPRRPGPRHYERDAGDLAAFVDAMLPEDRPRILVAHSMGGVIALLCLRAHGALFDGAVLSAPMLGVATGGVPQLAARLLAATATATGFGRMFLPGARHWHDAAEDSPEHSRTSNDAARCRLHRAWFKARPDLVLEGPTYGWLHAAFRAVDRLQDSRLLAGIATPILMASAGIDSFVDPVAQRRAAERLPDCTLIALPSSKHEPFLEVDAIRDRWLSEIDRFVTGVVARRISGRGSDAGSG